METLPIEITRKIYEYDSTYRNVFNKVLIQLKCHFFIYNCHLCFKRWQKCLCYCSVCHTYLKYCHQIYYDQEEEDYEDVLPDIVQLGFG